MRSTVISGWFWIGVLALTVICVLCVALVVPAMAQEEPPPEPELGARVDIFLAFALPAMILIQTALAQVLKWVLPNTVVSTETIANLVRGLFAILFIGAWFAGVGDQLAAGVGVLNEASGPVLTLLALIGSLLTNWVGPSALYDWAQKRNLPFLGQKQGSRVLAYARDQDVNWRRAA